MKRAASSLILAAVILALWATAAAACHINANCYTAELVDNWRNDHITVRYADNFTTVLETHTFTTTVANNGPHGHVTSAGFHNGNEWRYVSAPYDCVKPTTTTTTEAPTSTTTSTLVPTTTSTSFTTDTTAPIQSTTSTTKAPTTTSAPTQEQTTSTTVAPTTTSTAVIKIGGPPASAVQQPHTPVASPPRTGELPHTGNDGLAVVLVVAAVFLLAGFTFVASTRRNGR